MKAIKKKIVTDEEARPVAVQIDYEDWIEIERLLDSREADDEFEKLLEETEGTWKHGDGLEYQIRIREEWDHRP
ncbi:MAG: hypothetical protein H0U65_10375 [Rubrobacter sp.]|jgi:hypothetical protein|nr:hypothetical protein [Rubrobacter sp.]